MRDRYSECPESSPASAARPGGMPRGSIHSLYPSTHPPVTAPDPRDPEPPKGTVVSNEDTLAGLAEIVEEVAGVNASDVTADKSFTDDLDIDSLSMVEIAV